jgi:hypothetical protein
MPLAPHSQSNDITRAFCTKVGDVVPVSFMKEVPDPVIKENDDYPEWVFSLGDKSAGRNMSKAQLLKKIEEDGLESLTAEQMMRAKRLLTLEKIKDNNVAGR